MDQIWLEKETLTAHKETIKAATCGGGKRAKGGKCGGGGGGCQWLNGQVTPPGVCGHAEYRVLPHSQETVQ